MLTLLFSLISTCQNCSGKVTLYLCQRFYFFQIIFQIFFFIGLYLLQLVRETEGVYCDLQSYSSYFTDGKTQECFGQGYVLQSRGRASSDKPLPNNESRALLIHPQDCSETWACL